MSVLIYPPRKPGWVPDDSLGSRLLRLRKDANLTVEQAASLCNEISHASWSLYENGKIPPDVVGFCRKVSEGTGVNEEWLLWGDSGAQNLKEMNPARRGRKALKDRTRPADTRPAGTPAFVPA